MSFILIHLHPFISRVSEKPCCTTRACSHKCCATCTHLCIVTAHRSEFSVDTFNGPSYGPSHFPLTGRYNGWLSFTCCSDIWCSNCVLAICWLLLRGRFFFDLVAYFQGFFFDPTTRFTAHLPVGSGTKCVYFTLLWMYWFFLSLDSLATPGMGCFLSHARDYIFFLDPTIRFLPHLLAGSGTTLCTMHHAVHVLFIFTVFGLPQVCRLMPLLCSDHHIVRAITIGT